MRPLGRLKIAFVQMQLRKGANMIEHKGWVEKMPRNCLECKNIECEHQIIECCFTGRHPDCPLQLINDHDRELVKEVCEKIKEKAYDFSGYHICECGKTFDTACVDYDDLSEIIEKIQKEFEK